MEFESQRGVCLPYRRLVPTPVLLPGDTGDYRVGVRLNFRHLPPVLFDHIGIPHLKHLLEVVIDEYQGTIEVCR